MHSATPVWWARLLSILMGLFAALVLGAPVVLDIASGDGAMLVAGAIMLPVVLAALALVVLVNLQRFTVTTDGITVHGLLRRARIPWSEVAVVEVDRSLLGRGATVVVTHSGRRVRSELTSPRYALRRGEPTADHGEDLLFPARPTRAAIEAHRDFLRHRHRPGA